MSRTPIRVVLVEDSVTQREVLRRVLEEEGDILVAAEGRTGREGLELSLQHRPDLVVTDVWMPEMNGLEMTRALLAERGVPIVVTSATLQDEQTNVAVECLAAGALIALEKPGGPTLLQMKGIGAELRRAVRVYSKARVRRRRSVNATSLLPSSLPIDRATVDVSRGDKTPKVVGIAASTGGPAVLVRILGALPADYPLPVLIVQHITTGFEEGFVRWLEGHCELPVRLCEDGDRLGRGIYMCRNGRHLTVSRGGRIRLMAPDEGDIHCPSGDRLLASLADEVRDGTVGMVLTGMGNDGAAGLQEVRKAAGWTAAQDEASSMIWGMPAAAIANDAAEVVQPPDHLAAWLISLGKGMKAHG